MLELEQILTKWLVDKLGLQHEHLKLVQASHIKANLMTLPLFWIMWHHESLISVKDYKIVAVPRTTEVPFVAGGVEFSIYDPQLFVKLEEVVLIRLAQLRDHMWGVQPYSPAHA